MNGPVCPIHNLEAKWKEGTGAKGPYAFWSCPIPKSKNNNEWCSHKFPKPEDGRRGAAQRFNEGMAADGQKNSDTEKDARITRIAIAKSLIERGDKYTVETVKEFQRWVNLVEGKAVTINDEVKTEDIPF